MKSAYKKINRCTLYLKLQLLGDTCQYNNKYDKNSDIIK